MTDPDPAVAMDAAVERVKTDPALRAVLRTARAWGISPRRFLGWEPKITTRSFSDGTSIVLAEPEWDQETRDLAMAFALWEADLCPGCSQPLIETTAPENEDRFIARSPIRCHRCTVSSQVADVYSNAPHAAALLLPIDFVPAREIPDGDDREGDGSA